MNNKTNLVTRPKKYYPVGFLFILVFIFSFTFISGAKAAEKLINIGIGTVPTDTAKIIMGISGSKLGIGGDPGAYSLNVNGSTNLGSLNAGATTLTNTTVNGTLNVTGQITGGSLNLTGALSSANVSSGAFGSNTGGGNYSFPGTVSGSFIGSLSGTASNASALTNFSVAHNVNPDTKGTTGIHYFSGGATSPYSDGALYQQAYQVAPTTWGAQIMQDYRTGKLAVRGLNSTNWTTWLNVIDSGSIGSQSVNYANSANTSVYLTGSNPAYLVTAGDGNGLKFWSSDSYKISMGVGSLYQYGPVSDYSIKTQMDTGSTGRGFTWGRDGVTPIAALNSTSGNMQIAGTMTAAAFSGSYSGTVNSSNVSSGMFGANTGGGVFGFSGNRPVTINGNTGMIYTKGDASGWAMGSHVLGSSGTDRGGFGFFGGGDSLTYYYIGNSYSSPTVTVQPSNGGVGIGTTAPSSKLDVRGNVTVGDVLNLGNLSSVSTGAYRGITWEGSFSDASYAIYKPAGAWTQPLNIAFYTGIKIGANYGYGGTRFYNSSDMGTELMSVGNGDNNVRITNTLLSGRVQASGGNGFYANGYSFMSPGDTDGGMFSPADGTLVFATDNAEKMRILPSGKVGIGTTAPVAKLDVSTSLTANGIDLYGVKSVAALNDNYGSNNEYGGYFLAQGSGADNSYGVYAKTTNTNTNNDAIGVYGESPSIGVYGKGGSIGTYGVSSSIGAYGNGTNYGVYGYSSTGYGIYSYSGTGYGIYSNAPKNYFSGSMGIGTTNPGGYKLQVVGSTGISGNLDVSGTFNVSNSANFSSTIGLPGVGTNQILSGTGDGANASTYNFALRGWYGMALTDNTNTVHGYYNFRTGDLTLPTGTVTAANFVGNGSGLTGINATNADTVDGQHFSWSNRSNGPAYVWAADSYGDSYLAARGSMSVNYANSAGSATNANKSNFVNSPDGDRIAGNKLPTTNPNSVRFDFTSSGTTGTGGNYAGVMTYAPWSGTTASTGDASYQLVFGSTATNGSGVPMLRIRNGIDSTWNGWKNIITDDGNGVGTLNGAITAQSFVYNSDRSLKKNIATISDPLNKVLQLRGVTFNWKADNRPGLGLIAQEVETVFPELVSESGGIKSVQYGNLVAPLIEAVKAQQQEIVDLNSRIKTLEAKK